MRKLIKRHLWSRKEKVLTESEVFTSLVEVDAGWILESLENCIKELEIDSGGN